MVAISKSAPSPPVSTQAPHVTAPLGPYPNYSNMHHTPNNYTGFPPSVESNFVGGFFQPSRSPQMHQSHFFHQQSPMGSFSAPFSQYPPNQWNFPPQNQFVQFNPFTPNSWSNAPQFVDPHSGYIHPTGQQNVPMVNPIQAVPMDTGSKNSDPNPDLTTLHNIVNGKTNYFAPLQKASQSPVTKKRSKTKKRVATKEVDESDLPPRDSVPAQIRTRSTGKAKMLND